MESARYFLQVRSTTKHALRIAFGVISFFLLMSGQPNSGGQAGGSLFGFSGFSSLTQGMDFSSVSLLPDMDKLR